MLLDEEARERLEEPAQAVRAQGYEPFVQGPDGLWRLGERPDGRCHFLSPEKLCEVHPIKPRACRQFPFFLTQTPDGVQVGLSFRCTAVQRNHGRPLEAHRADLEALVHTGNYPRRGFGAIPFSSDQEGDWDGYRGLEQFVRTRLAHGCLAEALWQCASAVARGVPYLEGPPQDELMRALEGLLAASLIGYLETDVPEEMHPITSALRAGRPFFSRRLRRTVESAELPEPSGDWLEREARRYLLHLVERKFLLEGPSVLARLVALTVLWPVLVWYTRLFASLDGPIVAEVHWHKAVELVEGEVVGHVQSLESFYHGFETSFRTHLT